MSGKAAKGKGKSRGGGSNANRHSRSRNTTPASGSVFSSADTHISGDSSPRKLDYDELLEKFNIADASSFPTSSSLADLRSSLVILHDSAKDSSRESEKLLRETTAAIEKRKEQDKQRVKLEIEQQEKTRKAAEDAELKKTKIRKKEKPDHGDSKRPLATGSHLVTGQGPSNDTVANNKNRKMKGKVEPKRDSVSPSQSSDNEHQPPPAPSHVFFDVPTDDPNNYRIPEPDEIAQMSVEEKKKTFSVAQYPLDDLSSLIPGDPPDEDFSKAKPSNQVAINTFSAFIDPYFRPYSEEDLAFLRERGDRVTPFLMPKLGKHYSETWAEEEGSTTYASPAPPTNSSDNRNGIGPKGKPDDISEEQLEQEEISTGPLLTRVLAALMQEEPEEDGENLPDGISHTPATSLSLPEKDGYKVPVGKSDYATMEERIRREMVHVGLLNPDDDPDFEAKEDDQLCQRLRELQAQLRQQTAENGARKARVMDKLKDQMAYQEYMTILEDLDKQVNITVYGFFMIKWDIYVEKKEGDEGPPVSSPRQRRMDGHRRRHAQRRRALLRNRKQPSKAAEDEDRDVAMLDGPKSSDADSSETTQVEQAYTKRSRNMKATKKKKPVANGVGVAQARVGIGEQARLIMERRKRWIAAIGPVFDDNVTSLPKESIFNDLDELTELEKANAMAEEEG